MMNEVELWKRLDRLIDVLERIAVKLESPPMMVNPNQFKYEGSETGRFSSDKPNFEVVEKPHD